MTADTKATGAPVARAPRSVALLLPGQGSQYRRMAAGLYAAEPVFAEAVDEVLGAMGAEGARMHADWLAERPELPVDHVLRAQPLLFAVDYALGRLVTSWGIRPVALLGHSIGEMAAATLAGVFTVRDAARVVLDRVTRLTAAPPGGMLAVAESAASLEPFLGGGVVVGAVNAPRQTVLGGPEDALRAVGETLRARGITAQRVPALSPFHSPAIAPHAKGAEAVLATVERRPPRTVVHSCYTAAPLTAQQVADPAYWAAHPVDQVRFWPALDGLLSPGGLVVVEAGPGRTLSSLALRHPSVRRGDCMVVPLSPKRAGGPEDDRVALAEAMDALRGEGYRIP
ncbi:acyltransferase domain-containing protein [Streptomyces rimosus]|uniref:acyltransferase domain-containing protein n=1 Tax=Streptomyces rimosus TaxID=1927 RepID=UPI0031D8BBB0